MRFRNSVDWKSSAVTLQKYNISRYQKVNKVMSMETNELIIFLNKLANNYEK